MPAVAVAVAIIAIMVVACLPRRSTGDGSLAEIITIAVIAAVVIVLAFIKG